MSAEQRPPEPVAAVPLRLPAHPYPLVVVRWRDAYRSDGEELAEDVRASSPSRVCVLTGWLVRDDAEGVAVAAEYDEAAPGTVRSTWRVPRSMVLDVRPVAVRQSRRGKGGA